MAIVIDPNWVEIQTGLYLEEYQRVIAGNTYTIRKLHSSDGYCFYDAELPEEERIYMQNATLANQFSSWTHEQLNARWISIPIEDGMEIEGVPAQDESAASRADEEEKERLKEMEDGEI